MSTTDAILARCKELGFAAAGVANAELSPHAAFFRTWLDEGKQGEMEYLSAHFEKRMDPRELLPSAKSVICVADRYANASRDRPPQRDGSRRGKIARYARGDDYHKVIKKRLHILCDELSAQHPNAAFKTCVDTAPLLERELAQRAGLGAVGKHTLIIERGVGSYLLLGAIVTTLELAPTNPAAPDPCSTCTRCIDACPTDAITPWSVDASRCISYLTIEHRSAIDPAFHEAFGDWLFGCDICQEVCPHNQITHRTMNEAVHAAYQPRTSSLELLEVLNWTEEDRRDAFQRSSMKRAKLYMIKRNAIINAANALRDSDSPALREKIRSLAMDSSEHEVVRSTAQHVLESLEEPHSSRA